MDYKITLKTGEAFYMNGADFDAQAVTNALNSGQLKFVNLSGAIIEIGTLASMLPIFPAEAAEEAAAAE